LNRRLLAPLLLLLIGLAGCSRGVAHDASPARDANGFPLAARPVARIVSDRWSSEGERDRRNEAGGVMDRAGVKRGMTVADIGAGEGYYTIRLSKRVGQDGRVLAEDIIPEVRDRLAERAAREQLDNVSVRLGAPENPKLPQGSFDRVLMVHMYHEIQQPYAFLWHLRTSLKPDGRVAVVDADRQTGAHGTPPALLDCEFEAVGYKRVMRAAMPAAGGYLELFAPSGPMPAPRSIQPCDEAGKTV
jgi:ubiquinone/menaquinone biosynthesis C-methylase UbiE